MKTLFGALIGLLIPLSSLAQSGFYRNDWTTNINPQVNRGAFIQIQTNAGHKLVISVTGLVSQASMTNFSYWTNIGGLLRTIGNGTYTNFVVDTNVVAMTIGSIAFINPTNGLAGFGPSVFANNSGAFSQVSAFGTRAMQDNAATLTTVIGIGKDSASQATADITSAIGIGSDALLANSGVLEESVGIGDTSLSANSGTIQVVTAIGGSTAANNTLDILNSTLIGTFSGLNNSGVIDGSSGIGVLTLAANSGTIDAVAAAGASAGANNSSNITDSVLLGSTAASGNSGVIEQSITIGEGSAANNSSNLRRNVIIGRAAMSGNTTVKDTVIVIGDSLLTSSGDAGTNWAMIGSLVAGAIGGGINLGSFGFNNTFVNIGPASNRWIIGWNATNNKANSMVFGSGITNYNFRNVEYTFPAVQGAAGTVLSNDGGGILTWAPAPAASDATKIAILGGGGTNNTFTNMTATNVTATGIPATFMQGPGLTNDIVMIGSGGTNRWRVTAGGSIFSVQDILGVIGASVSGSANRVLSVNALRMRAADSRVSAYGFSTEAGFGVLSTMDSAGFGTVKNRAFTIYNTTSDQSGSGVWAMFHWTNSGTFTFLTNIIVSGTITATNGGFFPTNTAPHTWTNFAVAAANGITTNDARRSVLQGQLKWTLSLVGDSAQVVFAITNGASVRLLTNGVSTAVGAATGEVPIYIRLGPTNTFEIKTNLVGSGTATLVNMTMESE